MSTFVLSLWICVVRFTHARLCCLSDDVGYLHCQFVLFLSLISGFVVGLVGVVLYCLSKKYRLVLFL